MNASAVKLGIVVLVVLGTALPATAAAQTFVDPRQAAQDQYGEPGNGNGPPSDTPGQGPPDHAGPKPDKGPKPKSRRGAAGDELGDVLRGRRDRRTGARRGAAPDSAVRRIQGAAGGRGTDAATALPFTGLNLTTIIVLGLLLGSAGLGLRAVQARRSRRA